jgi:hypothetical protein
VTEDLFRPSLDGAHHYAYVVENIEAAVEASLGHDIEIHFDSQGLRDFFQMVREGAEGWDGSEPLRRHLTPSASAAVRA